MNEPSNRPALPFGEENRAKQQALRARMLTGGWLKDLEEALTRHIRTERRTAWGAPEMSRNPFRSLSQQIGGALYGMPPEVRGLPAGADLVKAVEAAGYWQLMQRVSTDLVGQREAFIRVDWTDRGGLVHRPVPLELLNIEAVPEAPDAPALVEEIQQRRDPKTGELGWCWEVLDIRDLKNPRHQILSADRTEDWTESIFGKSRSGEAYPYRSAAKVPYIPGVLYHAERTGKIFDAFYGVETVLGTLTVGVLLTFWVHGVKDGSFATVLLVGGTVRGLTIEGADGVRTAVISSEPGSLIEVAPLEDGVQPSAVQLQPGFDPDKLMAAITAFESGLAEYAGVSSADLVRTGADPRSGASLAVSREGLRTAQARHEPQLRRGDLEALTVSARVLNSATGSNHPETGYTISYPSLPMSSEEIRSQREDLSEKLRLGLISKIDAYRRLHPGVSREQAIIELQQIQRDNAMFPSPL